MDGSRDNVVMALLRGSAESPSSVNSTAPSSTAVTVPCTNGGGDRSIRSPAVPDAFIPEMVTLLHRRTMKPPSALVNHKVTGPVGDGWMDAMQRSSRSSDGSVVIQHARVSNGGPPAPAPVRTFSWGGWVGGWLQQLRVSFFLSFRCLVPTFCLQAEIVCILHQQRAVSKEVVARRDAESAGTGCDGGVDLQLELCGRVHSVGSNGEEKQLKTKH